MFVPAIAFAWWLVALPMKSLPAVALQSGSQGASQTVSAPPHARPAQAKTAVHTDADADDDTPTNERIPLRGAIPTDVVHVAQTFLDLPLGAERRVRIHDTDYLFVLEWHYHPPGFVGAPTGWHKGVTVYLTR
jgi:hypothetical protein